MAYYNKQQDPQKARISLEKAFELSPSDARIFMELDQLYKSINLSVEDRINNLEKWKVLTDNRDDLYTTHIELLNDLGKFEEAWALMSDRIFHPWEGGEGKVSRQYLRSKIGLALQNWEKGLYDTAIQLLQEGQIYPENLGEGKLPNAAENHIHYFLGLICEDRQQEKEAMQYFQAASRGDSSPTEALYYNDQDPSMIFYQGMALKKLEEWDSAKTAFRKLIQFGEKHLHDKISIDYFAVSLPDLLLWEADLDKNNHIHCLYMIALGNLGLGKTEEARKGFSHILHLQADHMGAIDHQYFLNTVFLTEKLLQST